MPPRSIHLAISSRSLVDGAAPEPVSDLRISAVNDQHGFLRWDPGQAEPVAIGDLLRLGLSHPCTAFDKWRVIPVIDDPVSILRCSNKVYLAGGEIQLTDAMDRLMKSQTFTAYEYEGVTHDCGDKIGLLRANVALALKRADLGEAARAAVSALL